MTIDKNDVQERLRSASDAILLLVREIEQLEQHKREVHPEDPRFEVLARAVRDSTMALADFTRDEEAWAGEAVDSDGPLQTIADTTSPASMRSILERWRAIERQLNDAPAGSPEAQALFDEFQRIRAEYMHAFELIHRSGDAEV
jgi:hypothetical protein